MLKFLIIIALSLYILSKIGAFFFRAGASTQQFKSQQRGADGKINVDNASRKGKKPGNFKGGDYIDFEEVKK